jgi:hypothetical protein
MVVDFGSIDTYLLDGAPAKKDLVKGLLEAPAGDDATRPFYEGLRLLGPRTPDLALIALRLASAGKKATDEEVTALRLLVDEVRAGGARAGSARAEYHARLQR